MAASSAVPLRDPQAVRELGAVYTPSPVADWLAERLVAALPGDAATVADLAAGEGALLAAIERHAPCPPALLGADVDAPALRRARKRLPAARLRKLDAVAAALDGRLLAKLGVASLDGAILNPPWGIELAQSRAELRQRFDLASGQYDSADIFVELTVNALRDGGAGAFLLPDSIFFPDRARLRRFLLDHCTIDLIARLGEGFFPGVYRGLAVVVVRRGRAPGDHLVDCLRLSASQRRAVIAGETTLAAVAAAGVHRVRQGRFAAAPGAGFSIDLREEDVRHVRVVQRAGGGWTTTLESGRGVELSKHGRIVQCRACGTARPAPRTPKELKCPCGAKLGRPNGDQRSIVRRLGERPARGWTPLIAGEDVRRYACSPGREIETDVPGINYKRPLDQGRPRLLFRKTGIGLKAALFTGEALTTQTVFHFVATPRTPDFFLAYALGVASSRTMQAVQLKRTGEVEWRSHPYVTQALLAELPIPVPAEGTQTWRQARAIAARARRLGAGEGRDGDDLAIESLVAGLYGLEAVDFEWVRRVLDESQGMEGITALRLPADHEMTPVTVD